MALLINLSSNWCNLLKKWEQVEGYFGHQKNLKLKFTFISIVCIIFSMVEHLSYLLTGIITTEKTNSQEVFEIYILKMFPQVFDVIDYNTWIAVLVLVINSVSTLTLCFSDQLIIMGSLAMGNYFQLFNDRMKMYKGQILTPDQWKTLRVDYTRLCNLARSLNDCLCHLLCVSLLIHLYIICVELHQGVLKKNENNSLSHYVHAILSFLVSSLRGCLLCLCSVKIYENSKLPKRTLYDISQKSYCKEVEFFMLQIQKDHVGLTGSHMFMMTRRFLLTVFGTIVSYEILLVQMKGYNSRIKNT
ncbi:Gustatory receptor [Cinara cedri]|uniref:Gustatory receptor n=1 Tax=Cinara cedri TaxID=506608 RepID=A0A5E4NKK7_9HEMI|nr:Gustatory receptor [Cinara cedri]